MATFLEKLTIGNGLLIVGGLLVVVAGLLRLRKGRAGGSGTASVPTVLSEGVAVLVLGYHMVAWGLNSTAESQGLMCVPSQWWWVLIGALGVLVAVSRGLDKAEAKQR